MKNSIISYCIFIVLIAFLTYADINFKHLCTDIIDMCDEMEETLDTSSKEENFNKKYHVQLKSLCVLFGF